MIAAALLASLLLAGDPEAHTGAMAKAVNIMAQDYPMGPGAPVKNGVTQEGLFKLAPEDETPCAYAPKNPYGVGCAYLTLAGRAINEPDNWACQDERQPEIMSYINGYAAPAQTSFATLLAQRVSEEAAMVCNWTHFTSNSILPRSGDVDAKVTFDLVRKWAEEIPDALEQDGKTDAYACDRATWDKYFARIGNALHYTQDQQTEHHRLGNEMCSQRSDPIPIFSVSPIHDFLEGRACMAFLGDVINNATGNNPKYWCDEAVMQGPRDNIQLNEKMFGIANICGFAGAVDFMIPTRVHTEARMTAVPLACMGFERTLRHHCQLDEPKTLFCAGPASDHSGATSNEQYCEGESYHSAGGEDFIAAASLASVPVLKEAAKRWDKLCKQPDDPCEPTQCQNWCERTRGKVVDAEPMAGFCMNSGAGDPDCQLHECVCTFAVDCGSRGKACCKTGAACADGNDECGASTGTCVEKGTGTCTQKFTIALDFVPPELPTDSTVGLSAHLVQALPEGSTVVWTWTNNGVGSLETSTGNFSKATSAVTLNTGPSEGTASFNVSARVTPPGKGQIRVIPITGSAKVKKGLTQIVFQAQGGTFACSDTKACGVSEYTAFLVPKMSKATAYDAQLSGYAYPSCNRHVHWTSTLADGGDCDFPVTYHPHSSQGPTNMWAVWIGFGGAISGECEVTITLAP